jgi:hypothetical protein
MAIAAQGFGSVRIGISLRVQGRSPLAVIRILADAICQFE